MIYLQIFLFQDWWQNFIWAIGGNEVDAVIPIWQLALRTVIVYGVALFLIRVAKRRFMGGFTTFDILLGFVVGSVLSRAITGAIRFVDMIVVISILIFLHWIIAAITYKNDEVSNYVKDSKRKLIEDGKIDEDAMQESKIGKNDLLQALREKGQVEKPEEVKSAYLERDGTITVIPNGCNAHIVEIDVKENIQTVKIKIEH
jgi:uncharacterized membrane protein YcaP (DUF421 family)